jgi:hypothetical protein
MANHLSQRSLQRGLDGSLARLDGPTSVRGAAIAEGEPDLTLSWEGTYGRSSICAIGAPSPRRGMSFMVRVKPPGRL